MKTSLNDGTLAYDLEVEYTIFTSNWAHKIKLDTLLSQPTTFEID